jgi:hypothetical protein
LRARLFIRSVRRPATNVYSTLASLCTRDPAGFAQHIEHVHVVSGDGDGSFLVPLERTDTLTVHIALMQTYKKIAGWKPKRRGAWSYLWALELACRFDEPAILMEDDIQACNGWASRLSERVDQAERLSAGRPFALSAYYGFPRCPFDLGQPGVQASPGKTPFWGNLMTFWPSAVVKRLHPFFRDAVVGADDMSTDLTVQRFLLESGGTLYYTVPSLVQHVGDSTTLRDDGVRRSPIYEDFFHG